MHDEATSEIGYDWAMHWVMSFAEEVIPLHQGVTFHGALWPSNGPVARAQADLLIAGKPTLSLPSPLNQLKRKYVIAHEFGHLQTLLPIIPAAFNVEEIDYCFDPAQMPYPKIAVMQWAPS